MAKRTVIHNKFKFIDGKLLSQFTADEPFVFRLLANYLLHVGCLEANAISNGTLSPAYFKLLTQSHCAMCVDVVKSPFTTINNNNI